MYSFLITITLNIITIWFLLNCMERIIFNGNIYVNKVYGYLVGLYEETKEVFSVLLNNKMYL